MDKPGSGEQRPRKGPGKDQIGASRQDDRGESV